MYLSNIKLWNFRKFGSNVFNPFDKPNLNLNFTKGLNVLIGENDSGKSAIIDAIKLVLKTHSIEWITPQEDDFYQDSNEFRIELRFDDLCDEEAKYFTEWLGWEGEGDKAKVYLRVIYDVTRTSDRISPTDVRAGVDEVGYPLTAEARDQLKITYLKPLRDAANELIPRKGSRLSKIFHGHEAFRNKDDDHYLIEKLKSFSQDVESYFQNTDAIDDKKGKALKDSIDEFIKAFCDDSQETHLQVFEGNLRGILEKLQLSIKDGKNLGLGTLNRLFMSSELLHLKKADWNGLRLGLIEELEAHLHPQAQMRVVESLQCQQDIQLILTTHSPNLASKVKLESLIICNNGNAFPLGMDYTGLTTTDYKFLEKFLDVTKSNLLFAKGVIFVEGWAEEILIPSLAKKMGFDLTKQGVSVVNVGGTAFLSYSSIFLRKEPPEMEIPIAIVTDSDVPEYEKRGDEFFKLDEKDVAEKTSEKINEKKEDFEQQKVRAFIAPNWTLEYSIFKSKGLSSSFQEIVKNKHSKTNWDTDFEKTLAQKLIKKALDKTEIAYRLAQKLDEMTTLKIDADDSINYLVEAIKYACGN